MSNVPLVNILKQHFDSPFQGYPTWLSLLGTCRQPVSKNGQKQPKLAIFSYLAISRCAINIVKWDIHEKSYQNAALKCSVNEHSTFQIRFMTKFQFGHIFTLCFTKGGQKKVRRHFQRSTIDSEKCSGIPQGH